MKRSDSAPPPRGARSPTYTPGKPQTKSAAEPPGPNSPVLFSWWGPRTGQMPQVRMERREREIGQALRDQDMEFGDLGRE